MFQTTDDILNIVVSVSVLAVAVALVWSLVYIIRILKTLSDVNRAVKGAVNGISNTVGMLQHKLESSASYLPLIVQGITKLVTYFTSRRRTAEDEPPAAEGEPLNHRTHRKTTKIDIENEN